MHFTRNVCLSILSFAICTVLLIAEDPAPAPPQPAKPEIVIAPEPPVAAEIRAEAMRKNLDPDGRPLPLASHWHRSSTPLQFQLDLIKEGHHIFPWTPMPERSLTNRVVDAEKSFAKIEPSYKTLAAWKLPVSFVTGGQWEADLYDHLQQWRTLPPEQSPLVWSVKPEVRSDGTIKPTAKMLSPFGAIEPWREIGKIWIDTPLLKKYQEAYPEPPMVIIISNNETSRLREDPENVDQHYLKKYGPGKDAAFKQKVAGDGWIERYGAMIKSMRESFLNDTWRKNSRFIAYKAYGPGLFGKLPTSDEERLTWAWHAWDGGLGETYDNQWQMPTKSICNVWSCQTEAMNHAFMRDIWLKVNPDFWQEDIFWDGDFTTYDDKGRVIKYSQRGRLYNDMGFPPTPERYRGWTQYIMWLDTPRVAREWRGSSHAGDQWWPRFAEILRAVDLVYADPVLTKFWRKGDLVPNPETQHPWEKVPEKYKSIKRWFHLTTNLDPAKPWKDDTRMKVYTLARVIGEKPNREWLLYGHGTLENQKGVKVTIPDYKSVDVDIALGGSFYHIKEKGDSVAAVGDVSKVKLATYDRQWLGPKKPERKITDTELKTIAEIESQGFMRFEKKEAGAGKTMASLEVEIPEEGEYSVWVLARSKPRADEWHMLGLAGKDQTMKQTFNSDQWTWVSLEGKALKLPKGSKAKKTESLKLAKGPNTLQLELSNNDEKDTGLLMDIAVLLLSKDEKFAPKEIKMYDGPEVIQIRLDEKAKMAKLEPLSSWKTGELPPEIQTPEDDKVK